MAVRKTHYRIGIEWTRPWSLTINFWRWTWRFGK